MLQLTSVSGQLVVTSPGATGVGYCLVDTVQAQFTLIQSFGPTLGLDNLNAVAEVGYINITNMPDTRMKFVLNAPGTPRSGASPDDVSAGLINAVQNGYDDTSKCSQLMMLGVTELS